MARRVFFSFHYKRDAARASQVRNIGTIEGNKPASDNDWEKVISKSDASIRAWIKKQMQGRSCTIILVGTNTANRKWINHEIIESWDRGMGVVGIRIHGLKNLDGKISGAGDNPFDYITHAPSNKALSNIVKCYNPPGSISKDRYAWIKKHIADKIDEAIRIRGDN